jgi:hypothetical protein
MMCWYVVMMVVLFWASNLLFYWIGRTYTEMERSDYE